MSVRYNTAVSKQYRSIRPLLLGNALGGTGRRFDHCLGKRLKGDRFSMRQPNREAVIVPILGLVGTVVVILISGWTLYLSHYREGRSEVRLLSQEFGSKGSVFDGGPHINAGIPHWSGHARLKITNTGDKGAYVGGVSHDIVGFRKNDVLNENIEATLERRSSSTRLSRGDEIDVGETVRYGVRMKISSESDIEDFVQQGSVIIRHMIVVEDNKGSYETTHESDMDLRDNKKAIQHLGLDEPLSE